MALITTFVRHRFTVSVVALAVSVLSGLGAIAASQASAQTVNLSGDRAIFLSCPTQALLG